MKGIKSILLLTVILLINLTAFTQTSLDSLKCFTIPQAKEIAKELKKGILCDSIIQNQELQILNFKEVLKVNDNIILQNNKRLLQVTKERNKANKKLNSLLQFTKFGIPVAIGGGFFIGFMLAK